MVRPVPEEPTSVGTPAPNPARPSRKTGRSDTNPAEPSRKTGRSDTDGAEATDGARSFAFPPTHPLDPDLPVPTPERPGLGVRVGRRRRLQAIAATQVGCFTTAQAFAAGLDRRARHHHLTYGNWRRTVAPGVFRLSHWPEDPHEHLRVWLLWAGGGASLTSWSALELLGRVILGPRATVHLLLGPQPNWRADRQRSVPHTGSVGRPPAQLHRVRDIERSDHLIAGMAVRPVEEALATALMTSTRRSTSELLLHELIAREIRRDPEARTRMLLTARSMSATRLTELIYDPRTLADLLAADHPDADAIDLDSPDGAGR